MFQSLRQNSIIYILHNGNNVSLETGSVVNISVPHPKFAVVPYGQQQVMVVDIDVKLNNGIMKFTCLGANDDVAESYSNGENLVIATNKEVMTNELASLKQKSVDVINSLEVHKNLIKQYDKFSKDLNPEYAEREQQKKEIMDMRAELSKMSGDIETLKQMNKELIDKLNNKKD